jgi:hypothetical protein
MALRLCYVSPVVRNVALLTPGLVLAAHSAAALELDTLLPSGIPGFGAAPGVSILTRLHPDYRSFGINLGGVTISPKLAAGIGYDSAPNGTASGSTFATLTPSLAITDLTAGFGAYFATDAEQVFAAPAQNTSGYTVALGERAEYATDVFTAAIARLRAQETGFALNTVSLAKPQSITATEFTLSDKHDCGLFTVTPEVSAAWARLPAEPAASSTDFRQGLTFETAAGGATRFVTDLHATETRFRAGSANANTYEALFGVAGDAPGLWTLRLLGGVATRQPAVGNYLISPVLEASLDWMPTTLDSLNFTLARELDDPERISAAGYTLTQAKISIAHEYLPNVIINASFSATHAAYFQTPLTESLFSTDAAITWRLNRQLTVNADYAFNDRQANFLGAANEHVITCNFIWTP